MKDPASQLFVVAQRRGFSGQQFLEKGSHSPPHRPTKGKKRIERSSTKDRDGPKVQLPKKAPLLEESKIEHEFANRDAWARLAVVRPKNSEGKILNRKM